MTTNNPSRRYAWIKDKPDSRDKLFAVQHGVTLPTHVDLSAHCSPVDAWPKAIPVSSALRSSRASRATRWLAPGASRCRRSASVSSAATPCSSLGYDDSQQRLIVRNSWGATWGDRGYFTMPYGYITSSKLSDDFWTIRKETSQ
jgi:hypothetical protein